MSQKFLLPSLVTAAYTSSYYFFGTTRSFLDLCLSKNHYTHYVSFVFSVWNAQISPFPMPRPVHQYHPCPLCPDPSPNIKPLDSALAQIPLRAPSRDMRWRRRPALQQRRHKVLLLLDQQRR